MKRRAATVLAAALLLLAPAASQADVSAYTQNFEALVQADPAALANDGWLVYGNVFTPSMVYIYGYGPYPAPNPGGGFCAIDAGQGGAEQGLQQLSVYSDYNNLDHATGNWIESNVYREQTIGAADVGSRWIFQFDAKLGNLAAPSTAVAFIKTLDPANGYALTNFLTVDMTTIPTMWATYSLSIPIDAGLVGQLLQIGFANTAMGYISSGVFYDNVYWFQDLTGVPGSPAARTIELRAPAPNPFTASARIEFTLAQRGDAAIGIYDVSGRRVATLFEGLAEAGPHEVSWNGRAADGRRAAPGVYRCVLNTAAGRQSRSIVLGR